ncbi:MAG: alpha/beta fold hydrolase [Turicibacter sp.]|nr:alpha/beta fold hydrolase [Turicibacter sp.]
MKKRRIKYTLVICFTVLFMIVIGGVTWLNQTYKPTEQLVELVSEDQYSKIDDFYVFEPKTELNGVGIVLYPGALVEPLSYAYYANELSKRGYLVAIAEVNLNLSIVDNEKASQFINKHEEIDSWYVGGHSMGGVSATTYASNHLDEIDGVILLGSYPASSTDLSTTDLNVLSLYAEFDGLSTEEKIFNKAKNLPTTTVYTKISGGNHAQFGIYGDQSGDLEATISVVEQQNQMLTYTLDFLKEY